MNKRQLQIFRLWNITEKYQQFLYNKLQILQCIFETISKRKYTCKKKKNLKKKNVQKQNVSVKMSKKKCPRLNGSVRNVQHYCYAIISKILLRNLYNYILYFEHFLGCHKPTTSCALTEKIQRREIWRTHWPWDLLFHSGSNNTKVVH